MDNRAQVKTHILRLFIVNYRFLGTQLVDIEWRNWQSMLNLFWNLFFVLFITTGILHFRPFRLQSSLKCSQSKPLFEYFVHLSTRYTYAIVYFLQSIYLLFYGPRLMHLLDSNCFRSVYHCKVRAKIIFGIVFVCNHAFFVAVISDRINSQLAQKEWPSWSTLYSYLCLYVVFNVVFWLYFILHYTQHATYQLVKQIEHRYKLKGTDSKERSIEMDQKALEEMKRLALVNEQLNQLLAAPLIAYLMLTVLNIILVISLIVICAPSARLFAHIAISCTYANYLAVLNHKIVHKVTKLFNKLRNGYSNQEDCNQAESKTYLKDVNLPIALNSALHQSSRQNNEQQLTKLENQKIRFNEIDQYCAHFRIQVFQLGAIDVRFLFQTGLFILGYVVFFTQTH